MIIVVEGPNGSGKSTLVNQLADKYNLTSYHPGSVPESDDAYISYMAYQESLDNVVFDRVSCISQVAYHKHEMTDEMIDLSSKSLIKLKLKGARFIYCYANYRFANKDYYPIGHYEKVIEDRKKIIYNYADIFKPLAHLLYMPHIMDISSVFNYLNGGRYE